MSMHFRPTPGGTYCLWCDKCGTWAERHSAHATASAPDPDGLKTELIDAGWTFWAGRSLRTYCPHCSPGPRHLMTNVTESWRSR